MSQGIKLFLNIEMNRSVDGDEDERVRNRIQAKENYFREQLKGCQREQALKEAEIQKLQGEVDTTVQKMEKVKQVFEQNRNAFQCLERKYFALKREYHVVEQKAVLNDTALGIQEYLDTATIPPFNTKQDLFKSVDVLHKACQYQQNISNAITKEKMILKKKNTSLQARLKEAHEAILQYKHTKRMKVASKDPFKPSMDRIQPMDPFRRPSAGEKQTMENKQHVIDLTEKSRVLSSSSSNKSSPFQYGFDHEANKILQRQASTKARMKRKAAAMFRIPDDYVPYKIQNPEVKRQKSTSRFMDVRGKSSSSVFHLGKRIIAKPTQQESKTSSNYFLKQ